MSDSDRFKTIHKPNQEKNSKIFFKTSLCPYLQRGSCPRGPECSYAHTQVELRSRPNLEKTKMCNQVEQGLPCLRPNCNFAHHPSELKHTNNLYKTSLCIENSKGFCKQGELCRYAHGQAELRTKEQNQGQQRNESSQDQPQSPLMPQVMPNPGQQYPGMAYPNYQQPPTSFYQPPGYPMYPQYMQPPQYYPPGYMPQSQAYYPPQTMPIPQQHMQAMKIQVPPQPSPQPPSFLPPHLLQPNVQRPQIIPTPPMKQPIISKQKDQEDPQIEKNVQQKVEPTQSKVGHFQYDFLNDIQNIQKQQDKEKSSDSSESESESQKSQIQGSFSDQFKLFIFYYNGISN